MESTLASTHFSMEYSQQNCTENYIVSEYSQEYSREYSLLPREKVSTPILSRELERIGEYSDFKVRIGVTPRTTSRKKSVLQPLPVTTHARHYTC